MDNQHMLPHSNELFRSSTNPQDNLPHGKKLHNSRTPLIAFCLGTVFIGGCNTAATVAQQTNKASQEAIVALEKKYNAAIGVSLRDAEGKVLLEWRSRERFPLPVPSKLLNVLASMNWDSKSVALRSKPHPSCRIPPSTGR